MNVEGEIFQACFNNFISLDRFFYVYW